MHSRPLGVLALSTVLIVGATPVLAAPAPSMTGPPVEQAVWRVFDHDTTASLYPNASVEHILENIKVKVNEDGTYTETKREIVRILDKRGQDGWSEGQEGYDSDHQSLRLDWARTIEPDGRVLPVASNAIKDTSPFSDYPDYDHYKVKTWTFPATEPGSIIDYHVTLTDTRPALYHDFADDDYFYDFEPARKMVYSVSMPKDRVLHYRIEHPDARYPLHFTESSQGDRTVYRWEVDNQGFTLTESDMPPSADLEQSVWVTTIPDWKSVNAWWLAMNKHKADPTPAIRQLVARLTRGMTDPDAKAHAIYDWVVKNIRYVYVDMQYTGFEAMSAAQVLKDRYGDCKGGSTLVLAMLRAAGIKAHYALLETAPDGQLVTDSPQLQFDHCIVAADLPRGLTFIDNVGKTVPYGTLPSMDQGALAMVTRPSGPQFARIPIAPARANREVVHRIVAMGPDGSATVSLTVRYYGLSDSDERGDYQELSPVRLKQSFEDAVADAADGGHLISYHVSDPQNLDKPLTVSYSYVAPQLAARAGDLLIFHVPGFDPGLSSFERLSRTFPMWFDDRSEDRSQTDIVLPRGYRIRYVPTGAKGILPEVGFSAAYRKMGDMIRFDSMLAWTQREIPTARYVEVRDLLRRRALFGQGLLVLERK